MIAVHVTDSAPEAGVDTPEDLARAQFSEVCPSGGCCSRHPRQAVVGSNGYNCLRWCDIHTEYL
jgi:hypothetical protein